MFINILSTPSLYSNIILSKLIPQLKNMGINTNLFIVSVPPNIKAQIPSLHKLHFYERDIVTNCILPFFDKVSYDKMNSPFTQKALQHNFGTKIIEIQSANDKTLKDFVKDEVIIGTISVYNWSILNNETIDFLKSRGFLWNRHGSILPEGAGLFLPFWFSIEGKKTHGVTLHDLTCELDKGAIIEKRELNLDSSKPLMQATIDMTDPAIEMILESIKSYLISGAIVMTPQDISKRRYYSFPTEDDIQKARKMGIRLWGSPKEMLDLYTSLYGHDERLQMAIINAIATHEGDSSIESIEDRDTLLTSARKIYD